MTLADTAALTGSPSFRPRRLDELPYFDEPGTRVLTVIMQKGGVGKTATAVGLADALAQLGIPVVLVDLCHTGTATKHLGISVVEERANLASLMLDQWSGSIADLAVQRDDNLWVIPCSFDMITIAEELTSKKYREERLRAALDDLPRRAVVIIDCPPVLNVATDNALIACSEPNGATPEEKQYGGTILCPELVASSLETQDILLAQCSTLSKAARCTIRHLGWFASETADTKVNRRARAILEAGDIPKLGEMPRRTAIADARDAQKTLREFDSKTPRSKEALAIWDALAAAVRKELHV